MFTSLSSTHRNTSGLFRSCLSMLFWYLSSRLVHFRLQALTSQTDLPVRCFPDGAPGILPLFAVESLSRDNAGLGFTAAPPGSFATCDSSTLKARSNQLLLPLGCISAAACYAMVFALATQRAGCY